ncbi:MAG: Holliday junction branch migration protein RuvA [Terrisporobacter othiniensis]|uniref:Holliday junction branch migration complex subunit RuvA n=1 Tax=Terrisporobacter petrolearius TaxID=1460447 RepID=A0ABZ3FHC3_9FIRM|nr:Holliday junction branch migration protein RuvA [Terrisporobacter petrolearius]MDU4861365.1 Holliday junction branch migration protein RuvA [Terrisporobacter othiniensis]MDU6994686.1 Holliday junction branch migration protein RuvA [Terrisporobacter othiniensis]UPA30169.1 Holliday junction branch migration protein RuvA [Terrisporobacter glycolicus]SFJ60885.1 Holliday junction DNA helicase subunit RuvA [Terrisporobacter glycolicus]
MYSYIKGIIEEISLDHVVIENNGIGYKINASANTIMKVQLGQECKIYTKLIVKEDNMSLCGFYDKEELRMFELLTSISKIGPKVGLGILSFASPKQIGAYILSEDIGKLSKAPGVGKKTAERIVLELKDKIDKNNVEFEATLLTNQPVAISQDEAVDALVALGYSLQESKDAVQKCKKDGLNTEDIIKKSLSYLMSKSLR